jgi:hypothetical protein
LWFLPGDGVSVIDPRHLSINQLPPPVHIEQVEADGKTYDLSRRVRLPALVRDVWIDYTALSFVAPEKVRFRYKLEGQDPDWKEVVNDRQKQYSNLAPGNYRFRVIACNNSGVWNEAGDSLDFSVDPAYYQTNWFRARPGTSPRKWPTLQSVFRGGRRPPNVDSPPFPSAGASRGPADIFSES